MFPNHLEEFDLGTFYCLLTTSRSYYIDSKSLSGIEHISLNAFRDQLFLNDVDYIFIVSTTPKIMCRKCSRCRVYNHIEILKDYVFCLAFMPIKETLYSWALVL